MLGADSTLSYYVTDQAGQLTPHYFNFGQKVFEVGEGSTLGIATWGLAGAGLVSHRTLIARLADEFATAPPANVQDAANRWVTLFWGTYSVVGAAEIARAKALATQPTRTPAEEKELQKLDGLAVGFCLAGRAGPSRDPAAFEMLFRPRDGGPPTPLAVQFGSWRFWGAPNTIQRLVYGVDDVMIKALLASGHWQGSEQDIRDIVAANYPGHNYILPLREAIDFVYSAMYATIKSLKFSNMQQICGGPIEVAVITTDRAFRWVRHKGLGDAIGFREGRDG